MIRGLAPLVARRLSFGTVPHCNGAWPLPMHPDACPLVQETAEELLLHGSFHPRQRGWQPTTPLAASAAECERCGGIMSRASRR